MSEFISESKGIILCPRADSDIKAIEIDLREILKAESRMVEVQSITPEKSGELCTAFTISWRDLHRNICVLEAEKISAQYVVDRRKAVILLDVFPEIQKSRKISSNDDMRKAVIALDEEHSKAQETVDKITAIIELLKGKMKAFEMSYTTVKKMMGASDTFNYLNRNDHLTTTGSINDREESSETQTKSWGKPRY